jgi:hypothetical protein
LRVSVSHDNAPPGDQDTLILQSLQTRKTGV